MSYLFNKDLLIHLTSGSMPSFIKTGNRSYDILVLTVDEEELNIYTLHNSKIFYIRLKDKWLSGKKQILETLQPPIYYARTEKELKNK